MSRKTAVSIIFSAAAGFILAVAVCISVFFYAYNPAASQANGNQQKTSTGNLMLPAQTPGQEIPRVEIKESEISSVSLETVYKEYFEESSNCRKSYNEAYGNADGVYTTGSPCNLKLSFNRDGGATKIIEMRRYDKSAGGWKVAESIEWKAKISDEQFKTLAKNLAENNAFKNYQDMMVTASNSKITVTAAGAPKTVMSNVDAKTTTFLAMMNAFKELEKKANWDKVQ